MKAAAPARAPLLQRLGAMLLGWGSVGVVYGISALRPVDQAHILQSGPIDLWFDFDPAGIWLYLSFFLLVPLAYLACAPARLRWLTQAMMLCALGAGLVFAVYPTTMTFPDVTGSSLSVRTLSLLISVDTLVNCLPSLHVALSILAFAALHNSARPWWNMVLAVWVVAITASILQLHRHQFVDLVAGAILAVIACLISGLITRWSARKSTPAQA